MATLSVFLQVEPAVQIHIIGALTALMITPFVLWRQRRDRVHKILGYTWVSAMALTALSSFAISGFGMIGPFSPLHLLAVYTLWSLFITVRAAILREIARHKAGLRNVATFGLGLPAVLSFLPERAFSRAFFQENASTGVMIMGALWGMIILWRLTLREDDPLNLRGDRQANLK